MPITKANKHRDRNMSPRELPVHKIKQILRLTHARFEQFFQQLLTYARQHKITYDHSRKHATGTVWKLFHVHARQQTCIVALYTFLDDQKDHLSRGSRPVHDAICSTMRLASRLVDPYPDPPEFTSFSQGCEALDIPERAVINHQGYQRYQLRTRSNKKVVAYSPEKSIHINNRPHGQAVYKSSLRDNTKKNKISKQSSTSRTACFISVVISHPIVNREEYQSFPSYNTRISPRKTRKFEARDTYKVAKKPIPKPRPMKSKDCAVKREPKEENKKRKKAAPVPKTQKACKVTKRHLKGLNRQEKILVVPASHLPVYIKRERT